MWTGLSMPSAGDCKTDTSALLASQQLVPPAVPDQYTTEIADWVGQTGHHHTLMVLSSTPDWKTDCERAVSDAHVVTPVQLARPGHETRAGHHAALRARWHHKAGVRPGGCRAATRSRPNGRPDGLAGLVLRHTQRGDAVGAAG